VITYPAVRQDVAVVVDEDVEAGALVAAAREAGGGELRDAHVFDVYHGDQVSEGRKSVAVHLVFQASDQTLTDEEADTARARVVDALRNRFDAELRG
jgi:phenylalanyl-tRNA synthetase beta chain